MTSATTESKKNLSDYQGPDRVVTAVEVAAKYANQPEALVQVKTMIPSLDRACGGHMQSGELYAISGFTKNGKTLLAQTMSVNFAAQGEIPLWFTFEVPERQFINQFPNTPDIFMPLQLKPKDMRWVYERIMEALIKYGTRIVFIDHLHYLFDMGRSRNPSLEIGELIRTLKTWTVQHELIIFLLCHTQQPKKDDSGLGYEKIRDSSFVAQESDSVFMIARTPTEEDKSLAQMRVEFHRRSGCMKEVINLTKNGYWLFETAEQNCDEEESNSNQYRRGRR